MSDARSLPRTGLVFDDPADLRLLDRVLEKAVGLSATEHERRVALRVRAQDAATRLDRKRRGR